MPADPPRPRRTAAETRAAVIDAALREFGQRGYDVTSTAVIARRVGVKQPYIYALFESKRHLFLACFDELNARMLGRFEAAVEAGPAGPPIARLQAMGEAYVAMIAEDPATVAHLQMIAAAGRDELRQPVRDGMRDVLARVGEMSGATRGEVAQFIATGLFLDALAGLGMLEDVAPDLRLHGDD